MTGYADPLVVIDGKWVNLAQRDYYAERQIAGELRHARKQYWDKRLRLTRKGYRAWLARRARQRALWVWAV